MTRDELTHAHGARWKRLDAILTSVDRTTRGVRTLPPADVKELSELYRSLAGDLMRVQRDKLGADLERYLHNLAARAHNTLYASTRVGNRFRVIDLLLDFPGAVRRNLGFTVLAALLFYGPFILAGVAAYVDEGYALSVMSGEQLAKMEEMYSEAKLGRDANSDALMTGFYVWNNVGIAFRCFATGLAFGLGSIFFLFFNGLTLGTVFGHLTRAGLGANLYGFVSSHSAWELNAIVISGAAGLQMGFALVATHGRTRLGNLQAHGLELLRQIAGAAVFLGLAALIEAWVSPSALPAEVKYAFGALGWVMVAGILFARRSGATDPRGRRTPEARSKDVSDARTTSFDARVVLRPRALDETIDLALAYAGAYKRDFIRLGLALVIPSVLALIALRFATGAGWPVILTAALMIAPLIERVITAYAGSHLFGNAPTIRGALREVTRRPGLALVAAIGIPAPLIPAIVTRFDEPVWIAVGAMVGMFWPFWLAQTLYFTQIVTLEHLDGQAAFRRASALVGARFSRALGFVLLSIVARVLMVGIAEVSAYFSITSVLQLGEPIDQLLENAGSWPAVIGYIAAAPAIALARLFDYVDARTRREGWDIQVRFKAIEAKARADRARRLAA